MLIAQEVTREYRSGDQNLAVLKEVSFTIPQSDFVAIVGPSGSGKTTLLGLLAGLDTPTRGKVILDGNDLTTMSENERARLRGEKVGFVFQTFQLIPTLTARENIQVPLDLQGNDGAPERALDLLDRVGLKERGHHFPTQLSGGEQQRVALARAFANSPRILFADDPEKIRLQRRRVERPESVISAGFEDDNVNRPLERPLYSAECPGRRLTRQPRIDRRYWPALGR